MRAVFAVMQLAHFQKAEDAWNYYRSSRQRFYEWKPCVIAAEAVIDAVNDVDLQEDFLNAAEADISSSSAATKTMHGGLRVTGDVSVEGDVSAKVFRATGADFAESFAKSPGEKLAAHQVVGLQPEGVSRRTHGAKCLGVVSDSPSVLGNASLDEAQVPISWVGWPGQITVLVQGDVQVGDYLEPSGQNDGFAVSTKIFSDPSTTIGVVIDVNIKAAHGACLVRALAGTEMKSSAPAKTRSPMFKVGLLGAFSVLLLALAVAAYRSHMAPTRTISHLLAMQSFIQQEVSERSFASPSKTVGDLVLDKYHVYQGGTCIQSRSFEQMREAVHVQLSLRVPKARVTRPAPPPYAVTAMPFRARHTNGAYTSRGGLL